MGLIKTCLLQEDTLYGINVDLSVTRRQLYGVNKDLSVTRRHVIWNQHGFVCYKKAGIRGQ